ncbi:flagella basal body P-ring formation protein FlgA [Rhodovulum sulfidophilum]|uniref:Flagella basal body P-ring formation protein FlgA n=1 Tax=Rhodovulum visakhapatnamense TaxID=364297 RepID=A0ABS1REP0_9RHOB|nr:flagellar basal body P-ring formation chaperone FlgA [Rhodovulum visakhapatnamense]MBL3568959.1 flagellar basal body P-ring formation protein FlgA [Rhodovulum visakhapatnamense]MBL3578110.1 flagellar basal body P-ring formation protein FlgA [Rhodovulum visakhapatnamense]OLS43647.1 flagella basal body P-ring formation protein FlgA [Rhodovulum sulfidophilum]
MRTLALLAALAAGLPVPAGADILVATRSVRGQTILGPGDVAVIEGDVVGTLIAPEEAIGQEARVNLYAGRPIRVTDVGPPAIIERNQIVTLRFRSGGLVIAADARALDRAGVGDALRVMNLASRNTVTGFVAPDGSVVVGASMKP